MKNMNVRCKIQIYIFLFLSLLILSCRNEKIGIYIGMDEAKSEQIKLVLNTDNSFKMDLYKDGDFKNMPQKTLVGVWEKDGKQLKLITKDDTVIYEQTIENFIIVGKSIKTETYNFKSCKKDFFASNYNLTQDKNEEKDN